MGFNTDQMRRSLSDLETKRRMDSPFYSGFNTRESGWQTFHKTHDLLKNGELWDFNGRLFSSEGTFPVEIDYLTYARFHEESDIVYDAKTGFGRALGVWALNHNEVEDPADLTTSNWTESNCTVSIPHSYFYEGDDFNKILLSAASGYVYQTLYTGGLNETVHGSVVLRRGDEASNSSLIFHNNAGNTRMSIDVNWTNETVTASVGTLAHYEWIDDDTVYVSGYYTLSAAETVQIRLAGTTNGKYFYATQVWTNDHLYPCVKPYAETVRSATHLDYEFTWPQTGTIEFWIHPYWTYNGDLDIIGDYHNSYIWFDYEGQRLEFQIQGGLATVTLQSSQFASNSALWNWTHVKACWDVPNDNYYLYIDGVLVDSDTVTDIGTFSPYNYLSVGYNQTYGYLLSDLRISSDLDQSSSHAFKGVPWYTGKDMTSENGGVIISPYGIMVGDGDISAGTVFANTIAPSSKDKLVVRGAKSRITFQVLDRDNRQVVISEET